MLKKKIPIKKKTITNKYNTIQVSFSSEEEVTPEDLERTIMLNETYWFQKPILDVRILPNIVIRRLKIIKWNWSEWRQIPQFQFWGNGDEI